MPRQLAAFALGHVLNDACAAASFAYLLLYLERVVRLGSAAAGVLMLIGQIADGLFTILATFLIRLPVNLPFLRGSGSLKPWHLVGSLLVLASFPMIFNHCLILTCSEGVSASTSEAVVLAWFMVLYHLGWSVAQLAHLSLIPELSPSLDGRGALTSCRYGATVLSTIAVYVAAWAALGLNDGDVGGDPRIGPGDAAKFRMIVLASVSVGAVATILFHSKVSAAADEEESVPFASVAASDSQVEAEPRERKPIWKWFCHAGFYTTVSIYALSLLYVNLFQAYLPIYLQVTLRAPASSVATIPLLISCSSFASSFAVKFGMRKLGVPVVTLVGAAIGFATSASLKLLSPEDDFAPGFLVFLAALTGAAKCALRVSSLTLAADLVGETGGGAGAGGGGFVYGAASVAAKVAGGAGFAIVQFYAPGGGGDSGDSGDSGGGGSGGGDSGEWANCSSETGCGSYYADVIVFACGGSCVAVALLAVVALVVNRKE